MARAKKMETATPSVFWKPENVGEKISGKFSAWQKTSMGNMALVLSMDDDSVRLVGMSVVLFNLFKPIAAKMKKGTGICIEYAGKRKRARLFNVEVNGKRITQENSFPPASNEDVASYFGSDYVGYQKGKKRK